MFADGVSSRGWLCPKNIDPTYFNDTSNGYAAYKDVVTPNGCRLKKSDGLQYVDFPRHHESVADHAPFRATETRCSGLESSR